MGSWKIMAMRLPADVLHLLLALLEQALALVEDVAADDLARGIRR